MMDKLQSFSFHAFNDQEIIKFFDSDSKRGLTSENVALLYEKY